MAKPVLAYDRIASNKRNTRWLIVSFALSLVPVLTAAAVWILPWVALVGGAAAYAVYGTALDGTLRALEAQIGGSGPAGGPVLFSDLPLPILLLTGALLLLAITAALVIFYASTAFLISRYGSKMLLKTADARPVDCDREPEFARAVEHLCIGAGLPSPSLHVVEQPSPNAFATGRDPQHASLVVTRGLLRLLSRRELEGVIAHELSHIGNHDIQLTTTLAALVGVATAPLRFIVAVFRFAFRVHWLAGAVVTWIAFMGAMSLVYAVAGLIVMSTHDELAQMSPVVWLWGLHGMAAPVYALLVAPFVALLIRQSVSRQREFLADADAALLTRDPEGLALALIAIGGAREQPLPAGEGTVHVYFMDPMDENSSWLHRLFPSHPPAAARIELLARMGNGIGSPAIEAALAAAGRERGACTANRSDVRRQRSPGREGS